MDPLTAKAGVVYRRTTDGKRLKFTGRPDPRSSPDAWEGWVSIGPDVYGKIVGPPWGWPWAYEIDPDQSWNDPRTTAETGA